MRRSIVASPGKLSASKRTRMRCAAAAAGCATAAAGAKAVGKLTRRIVPGTRMESSYVDSIAQTGLPAVVLGLREALDEDAAIGEDHALRGDVVGIGGDLDVLQPTVRRVAQDHAERDGGVAAAAFPR